MEIIKGKVEAMPDEAGYDELRIHALNSHFERLIGKKDILCASYCISRKGKVIANASIGPATYRNDRPVTPDCVYGIASITKTFTTVAIMQLVEDGLLRLDNKVGRFLPQFDTPPFNEITIMHLLTHTSGLYPDGGCFQNKYHISPWDFIAEKAKTDGQNTDWISEALKSGMRRKPDEEWQYCSIGFLYLGAVIEVLSGMDSGEYIEKRIAEPLGLKDTTFNPLPEVMERSVIPDKEYEDWLSGKVNGNEPGGDIRWPKIPQTGGGLFSTTWDLVRYGNMLMRMGSFENVRILGRKSIETITTQVLKNIPDYCWGANTKERQYGVGFDMRRGDAIIVSPGTFQHEGAGASILVVDPKEELVASWFVPFFNYQWKDEAIFNTTNVIWSGIK